MANICTTDYKIHGDREALLELRAYLNKRAPMNCTDISLSEFCEAFGIDWQGNGICVRGDITYWEYTEPEEGWGELTICTDTAWSGCHDVFRAVNEALGGGLSISYMETEPGCQLFYIHDEGDYFPFDCHVDCYGNPFDSCYSEYESVSKAIDDWCEAMGIARDASKTEDEYIDLINEYEYDEADTYYLIHRFIHE